MIKPLVALVILSFSGAAQAQQAASPQSPPPSAGPQAGELGAGVILGQPIGGTAKYWLTRSQALDFGVGASNGDAAAIYGDYLWHAWDLTPQPNRGKFGVYAGLGPRLETGSDVKFGIRAIGGIDYWTAGHPIEIFLEGGPVFQLAPNGQVNGDIGIGIRFYFKPS